MDLSLLLTYRCNSRCQMCNVWKHPTHEDEEITVETLSKLPGGLGGVNLGGGEPTLREDLPEIVDVLYPKARVLEISSNGQRAQTIIRLVKKYPDIKVRISLDGNEATNNKIRGEKGGFQRKVETLKRLKENGGTDLGFSLTVQDENVDQLIEIFQLTRDMKMELATAALHNAWQFHKDDNFLRDPEKIASGVERLIIEQLKSKRPKDWFRAYFGLGLIRKALGLPRPSVCSAVAKSLVIDPGGDVWACNVRKDLYLGNLNKQSWEEITNSSAARDCRKRVESCRQNCWLITTARADLQSSRFPSLPTWDAFAWVLKNKLRVSVTGTFSVD